MSSHALPSPTVILEAAEPHRLGHLLSITEESALFRQLRRRTLTNLLSRSIEQSRLRIALVVLLTALLWAVLFFVFADAFRFITVSLQDTIMRNETIRALMSLFFASLTVMLMLSTGILLYGNLYCSEEVKFLLTTPVREERVFLHKFQEAEFLSAWAFLLLGSPVLIAYGMAEGAGWWYYAALVPFTVCFAHIPGCLGGIACLMIVRFLPAQRFRFTGLLGVAVAATLASFGWAYATGFEQHWLTPSWFEEALARMRFTEYRLLPNWWLSSGLLEAAHGTWAHADGRRALRECLLFLAVLSANALFFHLLVMQCATRVFRAGYMFLHGDRAPDRRYAPQSADDWLHGTGGLLPRSLRLLVLKDLKLFRRDPVQWSQFIVFFSLLILYFFNTRKLSLHLEYSGWVNMISFLNLAIIGLILSTFTTRFIFPLISLEGRRFWILGLLPIRRDIILWGKFLFAALGSWVPCSLLTFVSDLMLGVTSDLVLIHLGICALLCSGLSGIAVGLGARFPNFHHDSPARIAAGFGGTLTLVVSTTYIVLIVVLAAVPCHFYSVLGSAAGAEEYFRMDRLRFWWMAGLGAAGSIGVVATVLPFWLGLRWFRNIEF